MSYTEHTEPGSSSKYLSTEEAAKMLDVSPQRVTQLIHADQLDAEKVSGVWLVDKASVEYRSRTVSRKGGRPRRGRGASETRLMLRNRTHDVVELVYDSRRNEFTWMGEVIDQERAPIGVLAGAEGPSLAKLNRWWSGRGIPESRESIVELLRAAEVDVPEKLIARNLGLSLSDQYWVYPMDSPLAWEDINFFHHDFTAVSEETAPFVPRGSSSGAHPDNTTNGNLDKTWVIRKGKRVLLKGGRNLNQEPYNEVVATALHRRLLSPGDYAPYTLDEWGGDVVCACEDFLTDEEEYIPALYVDKLRPEAASEDDYRHYLHCCSDLGAEGVELALWKTIVCDDVLANPDRHWRNFGLIRNVETLEYRPAPIFDSGEGLWCNTSLADLRRGENSFQGKQFYPGPQHQLLLVDSMQWFRPEAFDGFVDEAMEILAANEQLEERLPYIREALEHRVWRIRDIREWE